MNAFAKHGRAPTVAAVLAVLAVGLALGACTRNEERVLFGGKYYPVRGQGAAGDRQSFAVTTRRIDQGLDDARKAGQHEGTGYCLENFGTSEIDWAEGETPEIVNGTLLLRGRCGPW